MTPEQWKQEFRNELDVLREPIERLDALLKLYPYKLSRNRAIRESFAALANEQDNERFYCEHWQELLRMEQNEWSIEHLTLFLAQPPEHILDAV